MHVIQRFATEVIGLAFTFGDGSQGLQFRPFVILEADVL